MDGHPFVLFICKSRGVYCHGTFGLWNSASFVVASLQSVDISAQLVEAFDANCIDRLVAEYRPRVVILEAIWVTPDKLQELVELHPHVRFVVRVHSKTTFLATEGMAYNWLPEFAALRHVMIAGNNLSFCNDMIRVGLPCVYLPNIYSPSYSFPRAPREDGDLHIGCFGAPRPMKNQVAQAVAAQIFGNKHGKRVVFHVNTSTVDPGTINVLKNLRGLFHGSRHLLVEHPWLSHQDFCCLVSTMDLGMQVSLSESYNIVSADFVWQGVPIVVSQEIEFVNWLCRCDNNTDQMLRAMRNAYYGQALVTRLNHLRLAVVNHNAVETWVKALES